MYKKDMLTATELQLNFNQYVNQDYLYYPLSAKIQICHCTDGTGKYFHVYRYEDEIKKQYRDVMKLRKNAVGISGEDRSCSFYRTEYMNNTLIPYREESIYCQDLGIALQKMKDKESVIKVYKRIYQYQPIWMKADATVIKNFLECIREYNLPKIKSLSYLEIINDWNGYLNKKDAKELCSGEIKNIFMFDWCGEFAYENTIGQMEILENSGIWEVYYEGNYYNEGYGELVVSLIDNEPMRLFRLHTGYEGKIIKNENGKQIIEELNQKWTKHFKAKSGIDVGYEVFMTPIEQINETIGNIILQYRMDKNDDKYYMKMYMRSAYKGWRREIEKLYKEYQTFELNSTTDYVFYTNYF